MNKECLGCGSILQSTDVNKEGFVKPTYTLFRQ